METRLSLAPGQNGTKKLLAKYGDRLVCVRYRYDPERKLRHKTAELIVETAPWSPAQRATRAAIPMTWSPCELDIQRQTCANASRQPAASGVRGSGCGKWTGKRYASSACKAASSLTTRAKADIHVDIPAHMHISTADKLYMRIYGFSIGKLPSNSS